MKSEFLMNNTFGPVTTYTSIETISDIGKKPVIYKIPDFYNGGRISEAPLEILSYAQEPDSYSGSVLKIGGLVDGSHKNGIIFGRQSFRYNPNRHYRMRVRVKVSGATAAPTFRAGFIGLTSPIVPNLLPLHSEPEANELHNVMRFMISPSKTSFIGYLFPDNFTAELDDVSDNKHFTCILREGIVQDTFHEYIGYISGTTIDDVSGNEYDFEFYGADTQTPMPMLQEVSFFTPFFVATGTGPLKTYIDSFSLEELTDAYVY